FGRGAARAPPPAANFTFDTFRPQPLGVLYRPLQRTPQHNALRLGAKGIKVAVSGRLGGAEIASTDWYRDGLVPRHTLRADIDY
ncbi:30S ribosomal protein S3, partial [Salmonella enterica subsp. enterica serovar Infantis]